MSESERKRRLDYKRNRIKWIRIQTIAILLLTAMVIASATVYYQLNKTFYINYTEGSTVDYKVQLKPNDYYDSEWLDKDQAYIAALVDNILANFKYDLKLQTESVDFEYKYRIDACLLVTDKYTGATIYAPTYPLVEEQSMAKTGNTISISETIGLHYDDYNEKAKSFIIGYGLKDAVASIVVTMNVNVRGACDRLKEDSVNNYTVSLNIPLAMTTVETYITSSVTEDDVKVLECSNSVDRDIFLMLATVFGVIDALFAILLVAFVYLTRNEDINYSIKVRKLFSNYRSYIQKITNGFDTEGYQILKVSNFVEMLGIRDTIQSPVLMIENEDQTMTQFMVPTATKLLYVYEIKVDNYDQLYGTKDTDNTDANEEIALNNAEFEQTLAEERAAARPTIVYTGDKVKVRKTVTVTKTVNGGEPEVNTTRSYGEADLGIGPNGGLITKKISTRKTVTVKRGAGVSEGESVLIESVSVKGNYDGDVISAALREPEAVITTESSETVNYTGKDGIEVVGVVISNKNGNKPISYNPDGEDFHRGDVVLVEDETDTVRKGTVAEPNHKVAPSEVKTPLKKIIGVVKRRVERALYGDNKRK